LWSLWGYEAGAFTRTVDAHAGAGAMVRRSRSNL